MKMMLALTVGLCVLTTGAMADQCPADQVLTTPREIENAPDVGVDRPILQEVDLTGWRDMGSFHLRMRRLTVAVGGIVPTHSHEDRPAIIYVESGEIIEHSSLCGVPVLHKAGDSEPEFGSGHFAWWENKTDQPVILISADVVPVEMMNDPVMNMP